MYDCQRLLDCNNPSIYPLPTQSRAGSWGLLKPVPAPSEICRGHTGQFSSPTEGHIDNHTHHFTPRDNLESPVTLQNMFLGARVPRQNPHMQSEHANSTQKGVGIRTSYDVTC